jgi:transposase-like protein
VRVEKDNNFGSNDRPACPVCGASMYLVRRTPHSDFGDSFERQTFRCVDCGKEVERSADKEGSESVALKRRTSLATPIRASLRAEAKQTDD